MLEKIYDRFQSSRNIQEKQKITPYVETLRRYGYRDDQVYASFGEDAAAIQTSPAAKDLILITTDAILPQFVQKSPYGAGFSAIYVGIDDIMACGGTPIACSSIVTFQDENLGKEIFRGIIDATNRFKIPLVRGHTTTDSSHISLSSTVVGTCSKEDYLSAGGAQSGDRLAIIWDQDGEPAKANPRYWNTIMHKSYEEFYLKRSFFQYCIKNKLFHACKDISNGGILGTLYQMLQLSQKGATVDLDLLNAQLKHNDFQYGLEEFIFLFLTSAFLVSYHEEAEEIIRKHVTKSKMSFYPFGYVVDNPEIWLFYQKQKKCILKEYF